MCLFLLSLMMSLLQIQHAEGGQCHGQIEELTSRATPQRLSSPGYPSQYNNNELCRWVLKTENEYEVVRFRVVTSNIRSSATCTQDYAEVKDGPNTWSRSIRQWCDGKNVPGEITSTHQAMLVVFRTDREYTDKGFEIEYWSVAKSQVKYAKPTYTQVNTILGFVFVGIMSSFIITAVIIALLRTRNKYVARKARMAVTHDKPVAIKVQPYNNRNTTPYNNRNTTPYNNRQTTSRSRGDSESSMATVTTPV